MHFVIVTHRLPLVMKKHRYMEDGYYIDYLGQMLIQMGYDIPPGCRTPADLRQLIPPFTYNQRGIIGNTVLTTQILMLDCKDKFGHKEILTKLLIPYNITLDWK